MAKVIRVGIANIDTTVGATKTNADKVIKLAEQMVIDGCDLVCFQEQAFAGYPLEDLVQWQGFVFSQWVNFLRFVMETGNWKAHTIFTTGVTVCFDGDLYNCQAVVRNGKVLGLVPKEKLPTYNVFYEDRTFCKGIPYKQDELKESILEQESIPFGDMIFELPFGTLAVETCEDIWSPDGPMRRRSYSGANIVVNGSASPFRIGVKGTRRELVSTRAADNQVTLIYVNQIGADDSLVFDGGGFINQNGRMIVEAPRWEKDSYITQIIDLDVTENKRQENTTWRKDRESYLENNERVKRICWLDYADPNEAEWVPAQGYPKTAKNAFLPNFDEKKLSPKEEYFEDLIEALIMGMDGYFDKTRAFKRIGVSLSGGFDSMVTAAIAFIGAVRRFDGDGRAIRDFLHFFSMPSQYNSDKTKDIARMFADETGASFFEVPIQDAFLREIESLKLMLKEGTEIDRITRQNVQARIRGSRMWNWANNTRGMWLQTGNMTEKAVGYTTIGGDMMGAYSLIGNMPKTVVIELAKYLYEKNGWDAFGLLLTTKASAELEDNQEDERDLMPFPILEACFNRFAGDKMMPADVYLSIRANWSDEELLEMCPYYKDGILIDWVAKFIQLFFNSIFKWVQAPEAVHIGPLDLDRERALQLPVVVSREWLTESLEEMKNKK